MIKTFRGKLADGAQDTIVLHTNDGSMGYRIIKFQIMPGLPMGNNGEPVVKVYSVTQSSIDATVDFNDQTLIAAAYMSDSASWGGNLPAENAIFDNMVFNQDIYVTFALQAGSGTCNYYIELEQVKLDLGENTVATLKDIRNLEPAPE